MNKKRKRQLWTAIVLLVLLWRIWPAIGIFSRLNLRVPDDFARISEVMPPASTPRVTYNGFSHPFFETGKLWSEILFLPRHTRHGHVFHMASRNDVLGATIAEVLRDPASLEPRLGDTMCGGFHADYLLEWKNEDGRWEAIVCMGCHEVIFYHKGSAVRCWFTNNAADRIHEMEKKLEKKTN